MINYYFYKFHSFQSIFEMVARIRHHTAKPTQDTQISADKTDLMTWNICTLRSDNPWLVMRHTNGAVEGKFSRL